MARPPGKIRASAALLSWLYALALLLAATVTTVTAAPEGAKPALSHTLFDNLPSRILYFDDSPVSPRPFSWSGASCGCERQDCERGGGCGFSIRIAISEPRRQPDSTARTRCRIESLYLSSVLVFVWGGGGSVDTLVRSDCPQPPPPSQPSHSAPSRPEQDP